MDFNCFLLQNFHNLLYFGPLPSAQPFFFFVNSISKTFVSFNIQQLINVFIQLYALLHQCKTSGRGKQFPFRVTNFELSKSQLYKG